MSTIHLAGCIMYDQHDKILLLHRNTPKRQQWEIPGGKVEVGESTRAAAMRELQEELGITVKILKKLGEADFTEDDTTMHYVWFLATIIAGTPRIMEPDKFDEFRYFSTRELHLKLSELSLNTQNFLHSMRE